MQRWVERVVAATVTQVLTHQRFAAVVCVVVFGLAAAGLASLRVDFRFQAFIGSADPSFADLQRSTAQWGADDGTLVVTAQAQDGSSLIQCQRLAALAGVDRALRAVPGVARVVGVADAPAPPAPDLLDARTLREACPADAAALAALQARVRADALLTPALVSADAATVAALVDLDIDTDDVVASRPVVRAVRQALADIAVHDRALDGVVFHVAGTPAVRSDLVDAIISDQLVFTGLTVLVMALLLLLSFRSLLGLLVPFLLSVPPALMVLGLMGHAGEPLGLLTQVLPTLLPVIGLADAIHVVSRFLDEARPLARGGLLNAAQAREATQRTFAEVGAACFFTSLTTAVGFGSLALADMQVLRTFGVLAAAGVMLAYVVVLVVGPLVLCQVRRLPRAARRAVPTDTPDARWSSRALTALSAFTERRRVAIVVVSAVAMAGAGALATTVQSADRLKDGLPDGSGAVAANDVVDAHLGGVVGVTLDARGAPGTFHRLDVLAALHRVEKSLQQRAPIRSVVGPGQLQARTSFVITGVDAVATDPALVAQLDLLAGDASRAARAAFVSVDGAAARVRLGIPDLGSAVLLDTADAARDELAAALGALDPTITVVATGAAYAAQRGFSRLSTTLMQSLLFSAVVIAALLLAVFGSLRLALIALPPNILPLVACLALMAVLGWSVNPTAGVVFCIALGIAVDDTLHFVARLQAEERAADARGDSDVDARRRTLQGTGRALVLTSVILGLGFAVNALSSFPVNRTLGVLGATAIAVALAGDLVLLPALLALWPRRRRPA